MSLPAISTRSSDTVPKFLQVHACLDEPACDSWASGAAQGTQLTCFTCATKVQILLQRGLWCSSRYSVYLLYWYNKSTNTDAECAEAEWKGRVARMLTYADVCCRMLTYADICGRMLTYADVYGRMLPYADVCGSMLTCADVC